MEYIFGKNSVAGVEILKTKGATHSNLKGFCELVREYDDSTVKDSFLVVKQEKSAEDNEGNCYDWYSIDKHNRTIDYTKPLNQKLEEQETQLTDLQLALCEMYEALAASLEGVNT